MSKVTKGSVAGIEYLLRPGDPARCMVLLHGIGSNAGTFERFFNYLPPDWTLLSWNAPGYGGSAAFADPKPRVRDYADRLTELVTQLGMQRISVFGHSLGTLIAAEFAARYPQQTNEVVLLSCAQGYGISEGAELPEKAAVRLHDLKELGRQAFAETRAPKLMLDPDGQPEVLAGAVRAMASINPDGYTQAVYMLAGGDLATRMADIKAPCLVMVGTHDRITPPEQSKRAFEVLKAAAGAGSCSYREIPDAGHIAHQEKPDRVAAEVRGFAHFGQASPEEARR